MAAGCTCDEICFLLAAKTPIKAKATRVDAAASWRCYCVLRFQRADRV